MIEGGEVLGEAMQWQVIDAGSRAACRSTSPYWRARSRCCSCQGRKGTQGALHGEIADR